MTNTDSNHTAKIINMPYQERRLGRTVLHTSRTMVDIDDILPNERQPRMGPKEDDELQRQIEANEGLFEPLLVEPHPDLPGKFPLFDVYVSSSRSSS
jgi:ParB family chromosome partitioning protein